MTCIIGLEHNNKAYIGGDRLGSNGYTKSVYMSKVFHNGKFTIGYAGSYRFGQLLSMPFDIQKQSKKQTDMQYLIEVFVPAIRARLQEGGQEKTDNGVATIGGHGCGIIGYKNRVYELNNDYGVLYSSDGILSTGSGSEIAYGAMKALVDMPPKKRIEMALQIVSDTSPTVGMPCDILKVK